MLKFSVLNLPTSDQRRKMGSDSQYLLVAFVAVNPFEPIEFPKVDIVFVRSVEGIRHVSKNQDGRRCCLHHLHQNRQPCKKFL